MSGDEVTEKDTVTEKLTVGVFWDIQTCPSNSGRPLFEVVRSLRKEAQRLGTIKLFKAYYSGASPDYVSTLQALGCIVIDRPQESHDTIQVDMMSFAMDHPVPTAILLISGNKLFTYCLSVLQMHGHLIFLMVPANADPAFLSIAQSVMNWSAFGGENDGHQVAVTDSALVSGGLIMSCMPLPAENSRSSRLSAALSPNSPTEAVLPPSELPLSWRPPRDPARTELQLRTASHAGSSSATSTLPRNPADMPPYIRFVLLVTVMEDMYRAGDSRPLLSKLGLELRSRNPTLYKDAGASTLGEYMQLARDAGIVKVYHPGPGKECAELIRST